MSLSVAEVTATVQGESSRTGYTCWLIRLAGCQLSCCYCDTAWARTSGEHTDVEALVTEARAAGLHHVLVTGGEPLLQPETPILLRQLCDADLLVALETSGTITTEAVDVRVRTVLDVKCPGSGMADRMYWPNLEHECLRKHDEVKFVLTDRADYDYALDVMRRYRLLEQVEVLLSPVTTSLKAGELARWMLADRIPARLGLQAHKFGWSELG